MVQFNASEHCLRGRPMLRHLRLYLLLPLTLVLCTAESGCGLIAFFFDRIQCGDVGLELRITGDVVDEATGLPLAGAPVGARSFTEGMEIGNIGAQADGIYFTDDAGTFTIVLTDLTGVCDGRIVHDELFRTDRVEIIVLRDNCEQRSMINVDPPIETEELAVRTIDIPDPITVPPCP